MRRSVRAMRELGHGRFDASIASALLLREFLFNAVKLFVPEILKNQTPTETARQLVNEKITTPE